jgi:putative ABC transport system permease protein
MRWYQKVCAQGRLAGRLLFNKWMSVSSEALMGSLIQDLRFALRQLRHSPGFAVVAVLTLSLGIGAATAVFSVIDAVLIRPLQFAHQDRLVFSYMTSRGGSSVPSSYLSYLDERAQLKTFNALAGYSVFTRLNLESPTGAVSLRAVKGTDNFFDVFGVKPILGRTYLPGEDQPGKDNVAVLSYEVWQSNFGGQPDAVGKLVRLDGTPYTVIGVMPAGFRFPLGVQNAIYTPLHTNPAWLQSRGMHWMKTIGLLKEGVSREQAQADINRVMANLGRAYPEQEDGHRATLQSLKDAANMLYKGGEAKGPLGTLGLAVLALLGIACVNVAGLLLARSVKREREVALRAAIGANRWRLIRQMVSESLVLCAVGLGGGMMVSYLLLRAMNIFLVESLSRGAEVHLNGTVLAVALVLSLVTSVAASLAPALRLSGTDPNRALRAGGSAGTGRGQHRLRSGFVTIQVALSLVLLVVSGLLLKNLQALLKTDLGFDEKKILSVAVDLSKGRYEGRDPLTSFYQPLLEKVTHLPGVQAAGLIDIMPVAAWGNGYNVHITGQPPYAPNEQIGAETRMVSTGYFDAMGIKLTRGRMLSPALDRPENIAETMVVNEAFRRKFFPNGGDPVGAHIDDADKPENKSGIGGVVTNVRQDLLQQPMPEMDWLIDSLPQKDRLGSLSNMVLVVRSSGDLQALVPSLRQVFREVDPTVPFREPQTMTEIVNEQLTFERMEGWLFGIFAGFALLLAVIGLYGLTQHEVELRTREIGIRMALGSTRALVMKQVLQRVALLMVAGLGTGWVLTLALKKVLSSVVEMHAGHDLALLTALTAGLAITGILTSLIPARRAASIEPMQALRSE